MRKKSTHLSFYHFFFFLAGDHNFHPTCYNPTFGLHLILTHLHLCRNDTKLSSQHIKFFFNSLLWQWYQFIHRISFAPPCLQGWGPFPELSHCLSLYSPPSCFNISLYFFPPGTSVTQQLSSCSKLCWGKRSSGSCGATRSVFSNRRGWAGLGRDIGLGEQSTTLISLY